MRNNQYKLLSLTAVLLSLAVTGCHKQAATQQAESLPTLQVEGVEVERREHQAFEEAVGSVQSWQRAEIEAKVSALVQRIPVAPGSVVQRGDLLVQLDNREIQARLDQATATLDQAANDLKRFTDLVRQETVTQAEFDAVQARERVARAAKEEAEAMLGYTRVTAPFDGVVTRKLGEVGDLALPGRTLIVVEDPQALRLDADVPEALIGNLQLEMDLTVSVDSVGHPIHGRVSEIAPAADPQSRTFQVKVDLPPTKGLRLGQFGRVAVPVHGNAALRAPASAVLLRGQMELVFVVQEGKAQLRLVKTGKRLGDEVELVSGVESGEILVVDQLSRIIDGQPVEVR